MPYKDPEQAKAFYREWKKGAKKKLSNKYYDAAKHANERAHRFGCPGVVSTADARAVLDGAACFYCSKFGTKTKGKASSDTLGLDHRLPLSAGGPNELANLVACCHSCNASKWRGALPGRWAHDYDRCVDCGGNQRRHDSHGRCSRCAQAFRNGKPYVHHA